MPSEPTAVRPASLSATVVLLRQSDTRAELLMVLRHARTSFGATFVFPGGLLGPDDERVAARCIGVDDKTASGILGVESGGLAYFSAAIRELFEEAGVLLARTAAGDWADAEPFGHYREKLNNGLESWPDFLERYDLRLACDTLHYFSFWVTPRELSRRFSTRFFAARMPEGQIARHCGSEVVDSRWLSAEQALDDHRAGTIALPHPTLVTLDTLSQFADVSSMLSWAQGRCRSGVECLLPATVTIDGEQQVLMPGDAHYPDYGDEL